jgi:TonB-dependent starch-binding outer membrane protein SusC
MKKNSCKMYFLWSHLCQLKNFLLIFLFCQYNLLAQQQVVTGRVTDGQTDQTMPGVNIVVKGTSIGTITDAAGKFAITVPDRNSVLVFSFVGYSTLEIPVAGKSVINASIISESRALEEVVVVGYGTMKKSSVTAAISKVENKLLDQIPTPRIETALVGRLSGVNISSIRNIPGEAPVIRVRGPGSIDAGNDPLVVIDGYAGGDLAQLSMNDVESIEILKDASSAAIYGSRGSGGVVIVTTKKGKTGAPKLNLNIYSGVNSAILFHDWILGQDWYDYCVRYQNREFVWNGGDPSIPVWNDARRALRYQVDPIFLQEPQTCWQNEVTQVAPIESGNLAISGGTDNVRYYISGTYNKEGGIIKTAWYTNYNVRANIDVKVNKVINVGLMLNPYFGKRRIAGSSMVALVKYPPFVPPRNSDGTYPKARDFTTATTTGQDNPFKYLYGTYYYTSSLRNLGEAYVDINLLEGLKLRSSFGTNLGYNTTDYFSEATGGIDVLVGNASDSRSINLLNENTLTYGKKINEVHDINALVGASFQNSTSRSMSMAATNGSFNNNIIHTLNNATINPSSTSSSMSEWGLISYFARLTYGYKEKYLLSGSLRTDGCSRFGIDNKWGYFPSASIAWRISQEDFMKNISFVSEFKVRGSYGATGNFNIGDFDYLGKISKVYYAPDNTLTAGMVQSTFENSKLGWEKTNSYDLGVELGLFNNRLNFVIDYYNKKTSDLLYNVSIPAITGFTSSIFNIGEVQNKGIELEITSKNITGAFNWQTSFNLSHNSNKVLDLGGITERINTDSYGMSWILKLGKPMFSYYGYKLIGVLQNADDVANSPIIVGEKPGNPKYQDINRDGKIDSQDRVFLGNFMPKVVLGMVNNFSWKNFDLSITMQSSLKAIMYNFESQYYQGNTLESMRNSLVKNQWWSESEPGDGKTPACALSQLSFNGATDLYLEDASYFFIKNLNFGYTVPATLSKKIGISSLRIYSSMGNLLMIKSKQCNSYNPEGYTGGEISGIGSKPGYNGGTEPVVRTITIGINVSF